MIFSVRPASLRDAPTLARLAQAAFRETFDHYSPDALEAYLESHHGEGFFARALADADTRIWIAETGENAIGYAKAGACALPVSRALPQDVELHRLYLSRGAQGRGLGDVFMQLAFDEAVRREASAMYLGVWERNLRAQRFYRRHGFEKCGEYDYVPIGDVVDREWIMMKRLEK